MTEHRVVLDTNVFVAAGFNPRSDAARLIELIRQGQITMVWSASTRRETQRIVERIPRLSWSDFAELFRDVDCFAGTLSVREFGKIIDREDRKFAALAAAADAILVSNDNHFLMHRGAMSFTIVTPTDYFRYEAGE